MDGVDRDFLSSLPPDVADKILTFMDNPHDILRASSVSRAWRNIVISNGICKRLFFKLFPQLSAIYRVLDTNDTQHNCSEDGSSEFDELDQLKTEHRVFAFLAQSITFSEIGEILSYAVSASSTDNYPDESAYNTLEPGDETSHGASYWSSSGQSNPEVPETLTYKLTSNFCLITEINVQPFQDFLLPDCPIYSAKAVRFRLGYKVLPNDEEMGEVDSLNGHVGLPSDEEHFVWTYISKEFPMTQENRLQNFKLPEPVLCIGGILQVELLGRVQRQEMDGLFYICVAHVQVVGLPLTPVFKIYPLKPPGTFLLMFNSEAEISDPSCIQPYPYEMASEMNENHDIGWDLNKPPYGLDGLDLNMRCDECHGLDLDLNMPRECHGLDLNMPYEFHGLDLNMPYATDHGVEVYDPEDEHNAYDEDMNDDFVA
ncbi:F-box protein At4g00755-like [Silene latifolia]|uniref:F-box protein At4g00755-like n=1 Tax=Silene latifolia TaxID=37657 RepID=UPI003D785911